MAPAPSGRSSQSQTRRARTTTDHEEIRRWAEERDAQPACVKGTGGKGDTGMIRLDFPGYSGQQSLEPISWDEWFKKFDESNLALVYQETTARGEKSNFNKLIGRETADARAHGDSKASRRHPERSKKASANQNKKLGPQKVAKTGRSSQSQASAKRKSSPTRRKAA